MAPVVHNHALMPIYEDPNYPSFPHACHISRIPFPGNSWYLLQHSHDAGAVGEDTLS